MVIHKLTHTKKKENIESKHQITIQLNLTFSNKLSLQLVYVNATVLPPWADIALCLCLFIFFGRGSEWGVLINDAHDRNLCAIYSKNFCNICSHLVCLSFCLFLSLLSLSLSLSSPLSVCGMYTCVSVCVCWHFRFLY